MAGTYTNLNYHLVFSTKERRQLITQNIEIELHKYIGGIVRNLEGDLRICATTGLAPVRHSLASYPLLPRGRTPVYNGIKIAAALSATLGRSIWRSEPRRFPSPRFPNTQTPNQSHLQQRTLLFTR